MIVLTLVEGVTLNLAMMKNKKNIIYYILAVVCSTAFFVHEFVPQNSQNLLDALESYEKSKSRRTIALNELKASQKGTFLFEKYSEEKINTKRALEKYNQIEREEHFLAFDNFKQFLGEFGWSIGLLLYSFFNLTISYTRKKKVLGEMLLHVVLIFISLYFVNWTIMPHDYAKHEYFIYAFLILVGIVTSTYFLVRAKTKYIAHLNNSLKLIFRFLYKEAEEKNLINPHKQNDFRKTRIELTDKIVGNE